MNKKIIIIIAVALAVLLIGAAVVLAMQNRDDAAEGDGALKGDHDKDSISSETDDFETTGGVDSESDGSDLKETEREEIETDKASAESTTGTEKETKPSVKDPAETKTPPKKPAETTKPAQTKPADTKPAQTKPAETKPADTKPAETKPAETKPAETKPAETKPEHNDSAPSGFAIYDGDGNKVYLSDFAGKPVILNFWASLCVPCKKEMPDFNEKYLEYGDDIQFLMIDFAKDDDIEDAKEYVSEMGYKFPIYFDKDGNFTFSYEVVGFPTTVFIDADGNVKDKYRGTISEETLQAGIDKILE